MKKSTVSSELEGCASWLVATGDLWHGHDVQWMVTNLVPERAVPLQSSVHGAAIRFSAAYWSEIKIVNGFQSTKPSS
jgi:hypothetical protein